MKEDNFVEVIEVLDDIIVGVGVYGGDSDLGIDGKDDIEKDGYILEFG